MATDDPPRKSPEAATLDDLRPVDTQPVLSPVATITLDEDPPAQPAAPPPTMILDPVPDVPAPRATRHEHRLDVEANAIAPTARKRAGLKADAFETSAPSLDPAAAQRDAATAARSRLELSPGQVALLVMGLAVVALLVWLLVWG